MGGARLPPTDGGFGLLIREPVGVVGAIVPWNGPLSLALWKLSPALLAGCTAVLKASPEAPGAAYIIAEAAEAIGLPAGVLNVLTADREVSPRFSYAIHESTRSHLLARLPQAAE